MFTFLKKKSKENAKITVNQFVALLLNDEKLSMPVYLPEIGRFLFKHIHG